MGRFSFVLHAAGRKHCAETVKVGLFVQDISMKISYTTNDRKEHAMFCRYCGTPLSEDALFCSKCGKSTQMQQAYAGGYAYSQPINDVVSGQALIKKFSERLKINAIIWIVIGAIQILLGLFTQWVLLIVGTLNIISAFIDLNYSSKVLHNPKGIISWVKPLIGPILTLIYNLFFGGVIGVVGSIYYLIAIRGFVMENKHQFQIIENSIP